MKFASVLLLIVMTSVAYGQEATKPTQPAVTGVAAGAVASVTGIAKASVAIAGTPAATQKMKQMKVTVTVYRRFSC